MPMAQGLIYQTLSRKLSSITKATNRNYNFSFICTYGRSSWHCCFCNQRGPDCRAGVIGLLEAEEPRQYDTRSPQSLTIILDQIQVLAPILCELDIDSDLGANVPSSLNGSLRIAILQCQNAADQLQSLARDLSTRVEASRGVRRRIRAAKIVLNHDIISRYERQLHTAMLFLSLAQQTYIL